MQIIGNSEIMYIMELADNPNRRVVLLWKGRIMAKNSSLNLAAKMKEDEFYTQMPDIENELRHYRNHFKGKSILCNCDDPFESNFFRYFALNFNKLKLKKLIATCYAGSPVAGEQLSMFEILGLEPDDDPDRKAYKIEITEVGDVNNDGSVDLADVEWLIRNRKNTLTVLDGDGDFASDECRKLLSECDICCTNPPFSKFRQFLDILVNSGKGFLIIGNQNNVTYKEVFPLLKNNQIWLGYHSGDMSFKVPSYYEPRDTRYWQDETGQKWRSMGNICWFTNLDNPKRHEDLDLYKKWDPDAYPKYDNYNAYEVKKVSDIPRNAPLDYIFGVPITFLAKYNPDQFEILGITSGRNEFEEEAWPTKRYVNAVQHNRNGTTVSGSKANTRATLPSADPPGVYYTADNYEGKLVIAYARILVRRKR